MIVILIVIILRVNGFFKQVLWDAELLKLFLSKQQCQRLRAMEVLPLPTAHFLESS